MALSDGVIWSLNVLQVIYLDADNFVVRDPAALFASPEYNSTAAIFWQDYWANTVAPEVRVQGACKGSGLLWH